MADLQGRSSYAGQCVVQSHVTTLLGSLSPDGTPVSTRLPLQARAPSIAGGPHSNPHDCLILRRGLVCLATIDSSPRVHVMRPMIEQHSAQAVLSSQSIRPADWPSRNACKASTHHT